MRTLPLLAEGRMTDQRTETSDHGWQQTACIAQQHLVHSRTHQGSAACHQSGSVCWLAAVTNQEESTNLCLPLLATLVHTLEATRAIFLLPVLADGHAWDVCEGAAGQTHCDRCIGQVTITPVQPCKRFIGIFVYVCVTRSHIHVAHTIVTALDWRSCFAVL